MIRKAAYSVAMGNIARWGDTDVFPKPLDNRVLADMPDEFGALLKHVDQNFAKELGARPPAKVIAATPNGYSGFRWATQLDPANAYLLSLVVNLAERIESERVAPESVFSHRVDPRFPDQRLFREDGYAEFTRRSRAQAEEASYVVVTDIADFYARVGHHRLENALLAVPKQSGAAKRIIKVLGAVSEGKSFGLPVGGPAARLLAELLLDKTDRALLASRVRFARFADDYRIFTRSEDEAHGHLASLADLLRSNEGLALQKAKTRIMTSAEFIATLDVPGPHGARLSDAELKARQLLNFSLRFDPYSPDPEGDYLALQEAVDRLDIVDLFSVELSKSRVDPQFTKKLLRALQFAQPLIKSAVAESLTLNYPLLAPVFPQVMGAIKGLWDDLSRDCRSRVVNSIIALLDENSYLLRPGVSRAYAVRVLAEDDSDASESALSRLYNDPDSDTAVRRDIILAMAKRRSLWWLSDLIPKFTSLESPTQRRAFLAATQVMTEEADHFIKRTRRSFSPLEDLTLEWAIGQRNADDSWVPPI